MKLSSRFEDALLFAARTHADQVRKGTDIPYVAHLLGVANLVITFGSDEDEAVAALLHDAIEDQRATRDEIEARFGARVAAIVHGCTDTDELPKPEWRTRKERYIAHLRSTDPSIRLVSAADKLDNARAILADYRLLGESLWGRFNGGRDGTLWYYRSVVETLRRSGPSPLVAELDAVVSEIERLVTCPSDDTGGGH